MSDSSNWVISQPTTARQMSFKELFPYLWSVNWLVSWSVNVMLCYYGQFRSQIHFRLMLRAHLSTLLCSYFLLGPYLFCPFDGVGSTQPSHCNAPPFQHAAGMPAAAKTWLSCEEDNRSQLQTTCNSDCWPTTDPREETAVLATVATAVTQVLSVFGYTGNVHIPVWRRGKRRNITEARNGRVNVPTQ